MINYILKSLLPSTSGFNQTEPVPENEDHYHSLDRDSLNVLLEDERRRVVRGGFWDDDPRNCRSAIRDWFFPDDRNVIIGFRVACGFAGT